MTKRAPTGWLAVAALAGWSAYSTLSIMYVAFGVALLASGWALTRAGRWREVAAEPGARPLALLWLWLAVSALWSPAARSDMVPHLWSITLLGAVPLMALALPPAAARLGLKHFVWASAAAAALIVLARLGVLPRWPVWQRVVDGEGNQRIAVSMWLALGAAFAVHRASLPGAMRQRLTSLALAVLCLCGEASQDRRSGMLMLLALLVLWIWWQQPTALRRAGVLLVLALAGWGLWTVADGVRARFAEGVHELRTLQPADTVSTSWGQRAYMLQISARLVAERPLIGHGLGSWPTLWERHTPPGSALRAHSTPHNEYLLLAVQGGVPAALLWLAVWVSRLRACWRAGAAALPAAQVWLTLALGSLFNAILRDAKFELTLLLLAALATAATRSPQSMGQARNPSAADPGRDAPSSSPR
ncbi:MAG: O-antigen ligase family protein [Rubrivivax sp.]